MSFFEFDNSRFGRKKRPRNSVPRHRSSGCAMSSDDSDPIGPQHYKGSVRPERQPRKKEKPSGPFLSLDQLRQTAIVSALGGGARDIDTFDFDDSSCEEEEEAERCRHAESVRRRSERKARRRDALDVNSASDDDCESIEEDGIVPATTTAVGQSTRCFLCAWGTFGSAIVKNEHMAELYKLMYGRPGADVRTTARVVHTYYRSTIYRNATLMGQSLPIWRTRDVYMHMMFHSSEPRLKMTGHLSLLDTAIKTISGMLFEKTEEGSVVPNLKNLREMRDLVTQFWKLSSVDLSVTSNYNPNIGGSTNPTAHTDTSVQLSFRKRTKNRLNAF